MRKPVTAGTSVSSASAASPVLLLFVWDYSVAAYYIFSYVVYYVVHVKASEMY